MSKDQWRAKSKQEEQIAAEVTGDRMADGH